jgi:hypothetical protein
LLQTGIGFGRHFIRIHKFGLVRPSAPVPPESSGPRP